MSTQPTDLPLVAIVGRPNVGKSTLFNRIVGRREAIVEEKSGVTRDRKEVIAEWQAREFRLVDTGGWMPGGDALDEKVSRQSEKAIFEADVVLFVVDVTVGITEEDNRVAQILRKRGRPVLLVANKVDDTNRESAIWDLLNLGVGDPFPVSALHGRGTGDLLESLMLEFPPEPEAIVDEDEAEVDPVLVDVDHGAVPDPVIDREGAVLALDDGHAHAVLRPQLAQGIARRFERGVRPLCAAIGPVRR